MCNPLSTIPTVALESESRRLERLLIDGSAALHEVDLFFAAASELGRRMCLTGKPPDTLDTILDPRD